MFLCCYVVFHASEPQEHETSVENSQIEPPCKLETKLIGNFLPQATQILVGPMTTFVRACRGQWRGMD
jgi:hypothetical protein